MSMTFSLPDVSHLPLKLTSGQAARLLRVTTSTVNGWIDAGLMEGFTMPTVGKHERRYVLRDALARFVHQHGLPAELLAAPIATPPRKPK
jgi:hypothetical protein